MLHGNGLAYVTKVAAPSVFQDITPPVSTNDIGRLCGISGIGRAAIVKQRRSTFSLTVILTNKGSFWTYFRKSVSISYMGAQRFTQTSQKHSANF